MTIRASSQADFFHNLLNRSKHLLHLHSAYVEACKMTIRPEIFSINNDHPGWKEWTSELVIIMREFGIKLLQKCSKAGCNRKTRLLRGV
jgi:hypothetical protein